MTAANCLLNSYGTLSRHEIALRRTHFTLWREGEIQLMIKLNCFLLRSPFAVAAMFRGSYLDHMSLWLDEKTYIRCKCTCTHFTSPNEPDSLWPDRDAFRVQNYLDFMWQTFTES